MRYAARGAITMVPTPPPEDVIPTTNPLFLTNHLEDVVLTTTYIGPVPKESKRL
jgi:hypothetical protein